MAEVLPGFELSCDTGVFAPSGMPRAVLDRIYKASVKGEENPRMKEILTANDAVPGQHDDRAVQAVRDEGNEELGRSGEARRT